LGKSLHFEAGNTKFGNLACRQFLPVDVKIVTGTGKCCLAIRQIFPICGIYALRAHLILPDKLNSGIFGT
jgi:hypothetical protein